MAMKLFTDTLLNTDIQTKAVRKDGKSRPRKNQRRRILREKQS